MAAFEAVFNFNLISKKATMEAFLYTLAGAAIIGLFSLAIGKPLFYKQIQTALFYTSCAIVSLHGIWAIAVVVTFDKLRAVIDPKLLERASVLSEELYLPFSTSTLIAVCVLVGFPLLRWFADLASSPAPP